MLKQLKFGFLAVLVVAAFACQNGDKSVREEALNDITGQNAQQANPVTPAQQTASETTAPTGPTTTIAFEEERFDFGETTEGEVVKHTYKFTNTGDEPLIISRAKGSCGCTVPKYTTDPIAPGDSGEMTVEFNTRGKRGRKSQKVTITANTTPPQTFIYIEGDVNPAEGTAPVN
jgi:hypothetical protein